MTTNSSKPCWNILSVEDNPADRFLIKRYFQDKSDRFKIHFAEDGSEGADFIFNKGKFISVPKPDLVILDLNLQKKDGRELLQEIKAAPATKEIPVFIFTTSQSQQDKDDCLALGAEKFLSKPCDLDAFDGIMGGIESWLEGR